MKYKWGYSVIGICGVNILVNMGIICFMSVKEILKKARKRYKNYLMRQLNKAKKNPYAGQNILSYSNPTGK